MPPTCNNQKPSARCLWLPQREDLAILAERHTTSKLRAFEDLEGLATLGFRCADWYEPMP